jgi:hypothetical protein
VAAWMSTRCPRCRFAAFRRQASAVRNTVGAAAALAAPSCGGTVASVRPSAMTAVPRQPVAWPKTTSPTLQWDVRATYQP